MHIQKYKVRGSMSVNNFVIHSIDKEGHINMAEFLGADVTIPPLIVTFENFNSFDKGTALAGTGIIREVC